MTNFADIGVVYNLLVQYFFGNFTTLALFVVIGFVLLMLSAGLDFKYSILFSLPLLAGIVFAGWLGGAVDNQWVINMGLLVVSVGYAFAVIKISS